MSGIRFFLPLVAAGALCAQHGYTPSDVENGGRLYRANCASCHGPNGDSQPGVDLGHGKFRRATADEEIAAIIMKGIPGTGMPPGNFSESQALTIVAYLRSLAASSNVAVTAGDPARGKEIFEGKGQCLELPSRADSGFARGPGSDRYRDAAPHGGSAAVAARSRRRSAGAKSLLPRGDERRPDRHGPA